MVKAAAESLFGGAGGRFFSIGLETTAKLAQKGKPMQKGSISGRRRELEEKFFCERDRQLLEALRKEAASKERKKALAEATGIADEDLIARLDELEIGGETLAALSLIPLIAVAWADGNIDEKERQAVLAAAEQKGMSPEHAGHQLLDRWLRQKPDGKLLEVWKGYVSVIAPTLSDTARAALKADLLGRARDVAETAGGLLGLICKVSGTEQAVIDELEKAFD